MSDIAIRVENLGKLYRLGPRESYRTLRDKLTDVMVAPFRAIWGWRSLERQPVNNFIWALKDVSFEIKQGEVVGVIGRNGAGKSTLLKILSRITEPTEGYAEIRGRAGSLLEVGTGFHPELTGRENIYLNGAILGMRRTEIARKFDEIVAFAEVEKFLDTPVKHYSSGMYVRLAFAVAAYLEPEILLVDEVLAVGDAAFQKKCLRKMEDEAKVGRTVVFVSHNMAATLSLCERAILLDNGRKIAEGATSDVVQCYLQSAIATETVPLDQRGDRTGDGSVRLVSLRIESTEPDKLVRSSSRLRVTIGYRSETPIRYPRFLVGIYDFNKSAGIFLLDSDATGGLTEELPAVGSVTCVTEAINLTAGRCFVNLAVLKGGVMADYVQYAGFFDVEVDDVYGSGKQPGRDWVLGLLHHRWVLGEA